MADILSTLRELRSLEEKRAHGTLSLEEEQRFQELQGAVSSRGPKPGPPTPKPSPPVAAPPVAPEPAAPWPEPPIVQTPPTPLETTPSPAAAPVDTEPPFVDADLTEEMTEVRPESGATEATVVQAPPPVEADSAFAAPLLPDIPPAVEPTPEQPPEPAAEPAVEAGGPVPMSPAELRQWNATFSAQGADPGSEAAPPVPDSLPAGETLSSIPEESPPEPAPVPVAETTSVFAGPPEEPAEPSAAPTTDWLAPTPLPLDAEPQVDFAPEPTVIVDDAPAVWSDPNAAKELAANDSEPAHDDGWTASVSWSAGIPPPEAADNEPTRLVPALPSDDPFNAEGFQAPASSVPVSVPTPAPTPPSGSGVTAQRMTPIGEAFAAGESRVVVHTLGGVQKRGTLVDAHMNADFLELRLADGQREMLSTAALKAVFFVVPIGQDVPKPKGDPVTVTLQDGHQLSGLSPDYQVGAVGFFLCPTDQRSRTAKIYIYASAVKGIA